MSESLLDETCKNLFSVLLVSRRKLRFNELHRTLNQIGLKMSKPTLVKHLNHLKRRRLLTRKKEGKQTVTYEVNWRKLEDFGPDLEVRRTLLKSKEDFDSVPIDDQVIIIHDILALRNLYRLRLEISSILDPSKDFEHSVQYLFTNRLFEIFKSWLMESCHKNKTECKEKALSTIEYNIKRYQDTLFKRANTS